MRYLNSAAFELRSEITSVQHAITLLGLREVQKWVSLVALAGMGQEKPAILVKTSMVRAKFCEMLAPLVGLGKRSTDLFLMGLLSMMDVILERPLSKILAELPISKDTKTALLKGKNRFRYVYELIIAYERGEWSRISRLAKSLNLNEATVGEMYLRSLEWAQQIFTVGKVA